MSISFSELALRPEISQALADEGYSNPTPIQAQAIPHLLQGRDLLGIAQTGTGKTAAFTLPILQNLTADQGRPGPGGARALILTPTRELAIQIRDSVRRYGAHLPIRHTVIFGGVGQNPQIEAMRRGVDILVATPGRLLDLINQGHIKLDKIGIFVLDEADRMLDMGFIHDVRKVVAMIPAQRQTLLFSATMPREIADLAAKLLRDPVRVEVTPQSTTVERIAQRVIHTDTSQKRRVLVDLLSDAAMSRVIAFTRTKHGANRVAEHLEKAGVPAAAIHGNKSQNARQAALDGFRLGKLRVLVATDIAARGIDIDGISHVVNVDLPNVPETYVHRIGRTGRAGAAGAAISLCAPDERAYLKDIEKLTRQTIPAEQAAPGVDTVGELPDRRPPRPEGRNQSQRHGSSRSHQQQRKGGDQPPRRPDQQRGQQTRSEPSQTRGEQGRPAQNRPAQNRPAQNRPAQNRPAQNRPAQPVRQPVRP